MNKRGMTMVEVLVAAGLLLMALAGSGLIMVRCAQNLSRIDQYSAAADLLHSRMEQLRTLPFSSLPALDRQSFADGRGQIFISSLSPDLTKIELRIRQPDLSLVTLRSSY